MTIRSLALRSSLLALSLSAGLSFAGLSSDAALERYQQQAQILMNDLQAKKSADIEARALHLVEVSKPILQGFIQRYPQCDEYLGALNKAADRIATLPLAQIETDFHADGALPQLTDARCYHAKDLLVHAATVQAMARIGFNQDKDWDSAEHEIEEVLEHFGQVEAALK